MRATLVLAAVAAVVALAPATAAAAAPPPPSVQPVPAPATPADPSTVAPDQRDRLLPTGWRNSADLAWTTTGDSTGFHLLVAESATGYTWRTAATLAEPGIEADRWVGNACLTGSGTRAVVVYAPRQFTNRQQLFDRGAFAAVVDLAGGRVTKLEPRVSLAYYNPGCGAGETAVLAQDGAVDLHRTRLHVLDTAGGTITGSYELPGQISSAVPLGDRVVAAGPGGLIEVDPGGGQRVLAHTHGTPYEIHADRDGGVAYLERRGDLGVARYLPRLSRGLTRELARGPLTELGLAAGSGGQVYVTGTPTSLAGALPGAVRPVAAELTADVSTQGTVAVRHRDPASVTALPHPSAPGLPTPVSLSARVLATGRDLAFQILPGTRAADATGQGRAASPALGVPRASTEGTGSPTDPVEDDRTCSVPRNDSRTQVEQPHWRQVEWAADLAVRGALTIARPANWKQSGLPAWSPQGMYPRVGLAGYPNATVPAAIMLGVLAQESNLWQASWHALEGVTGNPLIGNFYGNDIYDQDQSDDWVIRWSEADCGYGVAQVTDGMRRGDPSRTETQQRAIAVDYATNIAAGLRILEQKWNQTYHAGIVVNDGDPTNIENWFAAVWAYNTGMNPQAITGNTSGCTPSPSCTDGRGNWGLGWSNNPANPQYPANRRPFLEDSPHDASNPERWPYPEKVIGWAAFPIVKYDFRTDDFSPGYAQAWWTGPVHRSAAKPPLDAFCSTAAGANNCDLDRGGNPCGESDFHCWWHLPVSWKPGCVQDNGDTEELTCGFDSHTFDPGDPEPPGGTHYPPVCHRGGLPSGALIVDDVPDGVGIVRPGCQGTGSEGRFDLAFASGGSGTFPAKMDFHQIGSGLDGHFYFAHTWNRDDPASAIHQVVGTWTLGRTWTSVWGRVLVHLPGHGAHTQQAAYTVDTGSGAAAPRFRTRHVNTASRYLDADRRGDRWVSLGVFRFSGTPRVSLSNLTADGTGEHDIAYDAVAFQPLPAKPRHVIAVLGDSYTSGEGNSENYLLDYYRETDSGQPGNPNACHRSPNAWSRWPGLADRPSESIGQRADALENTLDYHMVACSGAQTENLLPADGVTGNAWGELAAGAWGEIPQLEQGYLDENTTLVALSIGGNDVGWGNVILRCASNSSTSDCPDDHFPGDPLPIRDRIPLTIRNLAIPSIETVLDEIHERAYNARIVLMGYPRLLSLGAWCLGAPYSLNPTEVTFLNQLADLLADELAQLAGRLDDQYPVVFSDPRAAFDNKGVCGIPEGIHAIVARKTPGERPEALISQQSFHPNLRGAGHYGTAFAGTLRSLGW
jgi:GDSL-like lipase/acylhydrolase family protein